MLVKEKMHAVADKMVECKNAVMIGAISAGSAVAVFAPAAAFAEEGTVVDTVVVDASLVQPIVTSISSSIDALLPIGISVMAIMIGVSLIPRIIYKFF